MSDAVEAREEFKAAGTAGANRRVALSPSPGAYAASGLSRESAFVLSSNFSLLIAVAAIFVLPNALFASAMTIIPATMIWLGCAMALLVIWRMAPLADGTLLAAPISAPLLLASAALAFAFCVFGGEAHIFYSNGDWLMRDSILADLVSHGFLVAYRDGGIDYFMRAPLGMYIIPAVFGWMFGLSAAHGVMLMQNAALFSVIFYFTGLLAKQRKLLFCALMVGFSGVEIVPVTYFTIMEWLRSGATIPLIQIDAWNETIEYTSNVMLVFWTPNHTLPGWCFAVLTLLYVRREIDLALLLAFCPTILFWSPLALIGVLPFAALFGVELLPRKIFAARNIAAVACALCFIPMALYLARDASSVPHGFLLWESGFFGLYVVFLLVEVPQIAVVAAGWSRINATDRRIISVAIATLLVIPFYRIGAFNDFATRVSVPSLYLLAFTFADIATKPPMVQGLLRAAIFTLAILSIETPIYELRRAFVGAYRISDCNLLTAASKAQPTIFPSNYLARMEAFPNWFRPGDGQIVSKETRMCWPDHPLLKDHRK